MTKVCLESKSQTQSPHLSLKGIECDVSINVGKISRFQCVDNIHKCLRGDNVVMVQCVEMKTGKCAAPLAVV